MVIESLRIRGPFRGASGYDHHVRSFVKELHRQGIAIELSNLNEWNSPELPETRRDPLFDTLNEPVDSSFVLQFCMPHQMKWHPGATDINFTMYESPRIPKNWVEVGRRAAYTILPTESSREAWVASGVQRRKLRMCPLGIDPEQFHGNQVPLPVVFPNGVEFSSYRIRFLHVSDLTTRKNPTGLLRTWLRATRKDDDAALLVKFSGPRGTVREEAEELFSMVELSSGRSREDAAPVHFIYDHLSGEDMARLYCAGTHYFSLSHGEGWDLPMTEAIASGLTPIAPDHSAYQEYLDSTVAHLIPSEVGPVRSPLGTLGGRPYGMALWWNPDERVAREVVRGVIDQTARPVVSAQERIRSEYSWEKSTARLISILEEISAPPKERRFWRPGFLKALQR